MGGARGALALWRRRSIPKGQKKAEFIDATRGTGEKTMR